MIKGLKIIKNGLFRDYKTRINFNLSDKITLKSKEAIPVDYFKFYTSVSSVYSSKIEGENIEADSFLKHKLLGVKYQPDYTKKADDLYAAYVFMENNKLTAKNVLKAHAILSKNILSSGQRGKIRSNPMFVINQEDRIEYVACEPDIVKEEWRKLFYDIKKIKKEEISIKKTFYYAALIHLVFLKIHPLQDGNGRTARLLEKWFLREKIGKKATSVALEKNYYLKKQLYYNNIRKIGLQYGDLNYKKSLDFLLMTALNLGESE